MSAHTHTHTERDRERGTFLCTTEVKYLWPKMQTLYPGPQEAEQAQFHQLSGRCHLRTVPGIEFLFQPALQNALEETSHVHTDKEDSETL